MRVHRIAALLRLVEKGDFATILLGAGQVLMIRILANTVGYASMILLARWMGSSEYGLYSFAIAWMTLLAYLATLACLKPRYASLRNTPLQMTGST